LLRILRKEVTQHNTIESNAADERKRDGRPQSKEGSSENGGEKYEAIVLSRLKKRPQPKSKADGSHAKSECPTPGD
jgi:hypothetical protein